MVKESELKERNLQSVWCQEVEKHDSGEAVDNRKKGGKKRLVEGDGEEKKETSRVFGRSLTLAKVRPVKNTIELHYSEGKEKRSESPRGTRDLTKKVVPLSLKGPSKPECGQLKRDREKVDPCLLPFSSARRKPKQRVKKRDFSNSSEREDPKEQRGGKDTSLSGRKMRKLRNGGKGNGVD